MKRTWDYVVALVVTGLSVFFGGWDVPLKVLAAFAVIDLVTGLIRAGIQKELSTKESWPGILRKLLMFIMVGVGHYLDMLMGTDTVRRLVILFYCAHEGLSIVENAVAAGLPVPDIVREILKQLNPSKQPDD